MLLAQVELTYCADQDWKAADEDLNAAYAAAKQMMQQIDADLPQDEQGADANLKAGQRAWVTFRDATCAAEGYAMHGGSAEPMLIYGCRARLTEQRSARSAGDGRGLLRSRLGRVGQLGQTAGKARRMQPWATDGRS